MKAEDFRAKMDEFWERVADEGRGLKDSYLPLKRLDDLYRGFDDSERALADQVLRSWVLSDREDLRFAAMSVIDDFRVRKAVSALQELVQRLDHSTHPGAPYERKKAVDLIAKLIDSGQSET